MSVILHCKGITGRNFKTVYGPVHEISNLMNSAKAKARCSHTLSMDVDKVSDQSLDF